MTHPYDRTPRGVALEPAPLADGYEFETEAEVTLAAADSARVARTVPASACGIPRKKDGSLRERAAGAITHVVIHTLQGHYANAIETWRKGAKCYKPHYVVRRDGEITQIVAERYLAQHANTANAYSIGIELDGFASDPGTFTEALYESTAALVRDICGRRGIPADRTHIVGHDEAPGTSHGDPGGYFDWEYFVALVNWNGAAAARPVRVVIDVDAMSVWPADTTSKAWTTVKRGPVTHAPHPKHSWSREYWSAAASARDHDPVVFLGSVPAGGTYALSAWWPIGTSRCPAVDYTLYVDRAAGAALTARVDQQTLRGTTRRTLALPYTPAWRPLGTVALAAGSSVWVEVSRRSARGGTVAADAIRLLKT
jgi:hypothetical protein